MTTRSTIAKASLAGVAGVMALSAALTVPTFASAQSGGYYDSRGYYYDPCRRDTNQRATTGGIIGALAGAAIGSNLAAHHGGRSGGAVLGALGGAAVGAGVGKSTAACQPGAYAPPPPRSAYYDNSYNGGYYAERRDYDRSRYDDDDYAYDRAGGRYRVTERQTDANGCTLAESPIYLPDGRVQKRFVRVCQDSSGRYQVVD